MCSRQRSLRASWLCVSERPKNKPENKLYTPPPRDQVSQALVSRKRAKNEVGGLCRCPGAPRGLAVHGGGGLPADRHRRRCPEGGGVGQTDRQRCPEPSTAPTRCEPWRTQHVHMPQAGWGYGNLDHVAIFSQAEYKVQWGFGTSQHQQTKKLP